MGHSCSVWSSLLLVVPQLDSLTVSFPDRLVRKGDRSQETDSDPPDTIPPPRWGRQSEGIRLALIAAEEDILYHIIFLWDTSLIPEPTSDHPSLVVVSTSWMSSCLWAKVQITLVTPPDPLVVKNLGEFSWNIFLWLRVSKIRLRIVNNGFCQGYLAIWRDQAHIL